MTRALGFALAAIFIQMAPMSGDGAVAATCGGDVPCKVANGEYRIALPPSAGDGEPVGAILFLHGWQGTAEAEMGNPGLRAMADRLGVALIAPQGAERSWSLPPFAERRRDEMAFIASVLDDATSRFPIAADRVMASGFSLGGSMVWYLACDMGERFAGFAPVAGAFWRPEPVMCDGPAPNLFHVHGTADRTVPMEGRPIGDWAYQGDVRNGFDMWMAKGGCGTERPETTTSGQLTCERRNACGGVLELCLHDGGHSVRSEWIERAWRQLAAIRGWPVPDIE
ncbi:MAG: alpha/beta hydrolase family esterase [Inquilinaceae bacterium]